MVSQSNYLKTVKKALSISRTLFSEAFSLYLTKYLLKLISNTPALSGSEPRLSSSGSSISKEEKVVIRRGSAPAPTDQISLPELDLTPASPVPSPVQLNIEPPTPTVNNRFVDLEGCSGNILHVICDSLFVSGRRMVILVLIIYSRTFSKHPQFNNYCLAPKTYNPIYFWDSGHRDTGDTSRINKLML